MFLVLSGFLTLFFSRVEAARADPSSSTLAIDAPSRHWYGWETLVADGVGYALGFTAYGASGSSRDGYSASGAKGTGVGVILPVAGAVLALGAPIMHVAHGRPGTAAVSFLVRAGAGAIGTWLGWALSNKYADPSCSQNFPQWCVDQQASIDRTQAQSIVLGLMAGALVGTIVDAALLAYEPGPAPAVPAAARAKPTIAPRVGLLPHGGGFVGVGGCL